MQLKRTHDNEEQLSDDKWKNQISIFYDGLKSDLWTF